jgi:hypothetical protein
MKTQAIGWLAAAVMAAGLNASYHQGGMQWAHRITDRVTHNTEAVIALATGNADRFVAEAQMVNAQDEDSSCRFQQALARIQSRIARSQAHFERLNDVMQAREEAQVARIEARRARVEAQIARIRPAVAVTPVVVRVPRVDVCPRIHVSVPRIPRIEIPATPVIHLDLPEAGPV